MPGPREYTSTTDLPQRRGGIDYSPDMQSGESAAQPGAVKTYDKFHGNSPRKQVRISESDPKPDPNLDSDQPEGVMTFKTVP